MFLSLKFNSVNLEAEKLLKYVFYVDKGQIGRGSHEEFRKKIFENAKLGKVQKVFTRFLAC